MEKPPQQREIATRWRILPLLVLLAGIAVAGFWVMMGSREAPREAEEERSEPPGEVDFGEPSPDTLAWEAARVGRVDIEVERLDREMARAEQLARRRGVVVDHAWRESKRAYLLGMLVEREAIDAETSRAGITVDESDVDAAMAEKFSGPEALRRYLGATSRSEAEVRELMRSDLAMAQWIASKMGGEPDEAELRQVYERRKRAFFDKERVVIDLVTVPVQGGDEALARTGAERARAVLASGGSVEEAALAGGGRVSHAQTTVRRGHIEAALEPLLFKAGAGATLEPVKTRLGFRVARVTAHLPAGAKPFEAVVESVRLFASQERAERLRETLMESLPVARKMDGFWHRQLHRRLRHDRGPSDARPGAD